MLRKLLVFLLLLSGAGAAYAELQNVQVGGSVRIRGRYWSNAFEDALRRNRTIRIPAFEIVGRDIGPFGVASQMAWSDREPSRAIVEQCTKIRFTADFTDDVKAVIELDDAEVWGGGDFRSNYITGADTRANSADDVEVLQSYIQTSETFGLPLTARIGRQQIKWGDGWLLGETQGITEQSFDAIRLMYDLDSVSFDAFAAKLAEGGVAEQDGDVDLYGLQAVCKAIENNEFSAYWLWLRDARSLNDTNRLWFGEWIESWLSLDDYDVTNLHTIGLRAAGKFDAFDYAVDAAFQTGDADSVGFLFSPFVYGDDGAEFSGWAGDLELGYTFADVMWKPRVFVGGAYYSGEDNRDVSVLDWFGPFYRPDASVSFNRLFSSRTYHFAFDQDRNTSNFNQIRLGVNAKPTDSVKVSFLVAKYATNEAFDYPVYWTVGRYRLPLAPGLTFWTRPADTDIGWLTELSATYDYSEDLSIKFTWEHLFTDNNIDEGNFIYLNGLEFGGGSDSDDADYLGVDMRVKF